MSINPHDLVNFRYERKIIQPSSHNKFRRKSNLRSRPKEHFLQTNFRFILSAITPPAHPAIYDADCIIDWDFVDYVCLNSCDGILADCPICLDTPRAAKITKCGHVFCTTCILRYLNDYRSKRCPMCFDSVTRADLRPVEVSPALNLEPNLYVEFLLLSRIKGTLTPKVVGDSRKEDEEGGEGARALEQEPEESKLPSKFAQPQQDESSSWLLSSILPPIGAENASFSRLVVSTEAYETECLGREEADLLSVKEEIQQQQQQQGGSEEGPLWIPYVEEALEELASRRKRHVARRIELAAAAAAESSSSSAAAAVSAYATSLDRPTPGAYPSTSSTTLGGSPAQTTLTRQRSLSSCSGSGHSPKLPHFMDHQHRPRGNSAGAEAGLMMGEECKAASVSTDSTTSYFFQIHDGQYVFLHPLNMKCLMADAEGQHCRLPRRVAGKVLEIETVSLTPELRSRYGFLKHLPLYSQIQWVELDLYPLLSETTYHSFKAEMKKRQQRRKNKERADAREKRLAMAMESAGGSAQELRRIGLTEEEVEEIKARGEAVDLNGPLPWQAMLIGEEKDPDKVQQMMKEQQQEQGEQEGEEEEEQGSLVEDEGGEMKNICSDRRGSFAEITRMNGHFPSLVKGEDFPALGDNAGGQSSSTPPPPTAAAVVRGGTVSGTGTGRNTTKTSPWGRKNQSSVIPSSSPPSFPSSTLHSTSPPWSRTLTQGSSPPFASPSAITTITEGANFNINVKQQQKKKGKANKGVSIFSTGSQRSYVS